MCRQISIDEFSVHLHTSSGIFNFFSKGSFLFVTGGDLCNSCKVIDLLPSKRFKNNLFFICEDANKNSNFHCLTDIQAEDMMNVKILSSFFEEHSSFFTSPFE